MDEAWGTTTRALSEAFEAPVAPLEPGTVVAERFRIVAKLGAGGMGIVYRARDEKLSRDVAIKIHARESGAERLEREATAMAQLTHPNVVVVHEVGTHDGAVFIAMELVKGETARVWCARSRRRWREVVRLYSAAGQGLVALHDVGLVHRDFKPDNVLVGEDGRVRVADLGLARAAGAGLAVPAALGAPATGVAGTAAYMSPEQRAGKPVDARSDQFSFCVALAEAVRELSPPRRVRRALARGSAELPDARWPSLTALLVELGRDAGARWLTLAGVVVVAGAVAGGVAIWRATLCRGGDARFDAAWNPATKQAVKDALVATKVPNAEFIWRRTAAALDDYRRQWVDAYTGACEATLLRHEQSNEALDRRMVCLDSRLEEARALTALISHADAALGRDAIQSVHALTGVERCADLDGLAAITPLPADKKTRARIAELRTVKANAKALELAGRFAVARGLLEPAYAEARQLAYEPLTAELASNLGTVYAGLRMDKPAEATLREAIYAGEASHHDAVVATSWLELVRLVGDVGARPAEGHELVRLTEAALKRLPKRSLAYEAALLDFESGIFQREGKSAESVDRARRALAKTREAFPPDDAYIASRLTNLGVAIENDDDTKLANFEEALPLFKESLRITSRAYGPDHPAAINAQFNIAEALMRLGRFAEADEGYRQTIAVAEKSIGPNSVELSWYLLGYTTNLLFAGDCAKAVPLGERALAIRIATTAPGHPDIADAEMRLAQVLSPCKRWREALAHAERAVAILSPPGSDEGLRVVAATQVGVAQLGLGQRAPAAATFARALDGAASMPPLVLAPLRAGLARSLPSSASARALPLAKQAREAYAALPLHYHRELDELDQLLVALSP